MVKSHCNRHDSDHPCPKCIEEETIAKKQHRQLKDERSRIETELLAIKRKERKEKPEPILCECGVGKAMLKCSFDSFEGTDKTKAVLRSAVEHGESIVLIGNTGVGKSHLAVSVLRELVNDLKINSCVDACMITVPELLMQIRATYGDGPHTEISLVKRFSTIPYLVLDDLGAEKTTDWTLDKLYMIIDARTREELPTIYTTNLSLDNIQECLGPRIASRLSQSAVIELNRPDYRRKRAVKLAPKIQDRKSYVRDQDREAGIGAQAV